jgi:hypothetical protein
MLTYKGPPKIPLMKTPTIYEGKTQNEIAALVYALFGKDPERVLTAFDEVANESKPIMPNPQQEKIDAIVIVTGLPADTIRPTPTQTVFMAVKGQGRADYYSAGNKEEIPVKLPKYRWIGQIGDLNIYKYEG